jgi:hypothetical protein
MRNHGAQELGVADRCLLPDEGSEENRQGDADTRDDEVQSLVGSAHAYRCAMPIALSKRGGQSRRCSCEPNAPNGFLLCSPRSSTWAVGRWRGHIWLRRVIATNRACPPCKCLRIARSITPARNPRGLGRWRRIRCRAVAAVHVPVPRRHPFLLQLSFRNCPRSSSRRHLSSASPGRPRPFSMTP